MAPRNGAAANGVLNKGAWTADEDRILAEYIETHGPNKWKTVATKSGLNRCGKSCRLRWLNYLKPSIRRGDISPDEEDLILRLHKLLGNRWSLIAGRLPGRTDNEIKNYWNSHLSKKVRQMKKTTGTSTANRQMEKRTGTSVANDTSATTVNTSQIEVQGTEGSGETSLRIDKVDLIDLSVEGTMGLKRINKFLELD